jgi:GNAT superfamily N-acetyltransferase
MVLNQELTGVSDGLQTLFDEAVELTTHSGFSFQVRSADESDETVLAEFFTHVTQDDLRFRFLSAIDKVGHAQLALLTQVDHRRVENFLAFDMVTGCLLASAMLAIADDLEQAEVAIVIRSDFKNRGIGWTLLEHAGERAAAMGVTTLQAIESQDNRSAIRVERDMGFTSRPFPGDATLTLLEKRLAGTEREVAERQAP